MRSKATGASYACLSKRLYCSRPKATTGLLPNGTRHHCIIQYATRKSHQKQALCEKHPPSRGVRASSSIATFRGIDIQSQQQAEDLISSLPITRYLRSLTPPGAKFTESRPYRDMHPAARTTHLVSASLLGPTKLSTDPVFFLQSDSVCKVIAASYIGKDICGHPGYVHGGLSFVLFDDVFARCAAVVFRSRVGMTASMSVEFRAPAVPDRVYVYRAEIVKQEGRKVWVEGQMRCLRSFAVDEMSSRDVARDDALSIEEMEGTLVAEAKALFIEPKNTEAMVRLYPV
ncbi:HotDog domain-containing protein [Aspergillus pseudoustus]|uniref:HotDog domain-containing protein n=1 Tax=Aspergillus pseudoustus TaxID=1810923 RepID=A0ABR4KLX9_9EURO